MGSRSPIRIEGFPCDTPLGLGTDLMEKSQCTQWLSHNQQKWRKTNRSQNVSFSGKCAKVTFISRFNFSSALNRVGFSIVIINTPTHTQRHKVVMKFKCCETFSCSCPATFKVASIIFLSMTTLPLICLFKYRLPVDGGWQLCTQCDGF